MGRLVMMASSHSKNIALKKATIYSFKLQQTIEGKLQNKLHSILACPYASKHLTLRHKGNIKHIQRTLVAWRCGKSSSQGNKWKIQLPFKQYVLLSASRGQ
jgi:hypothetical protein